MKAAAHRPTTLGLVAAAVLGGGWLLAGCGAAAGASSIAATATSGAAACGRSAPKLTVHGTGQASGTPNLLTIQFQIGVTRASAETALAVDNSKTARVMADLVQGGVRRDDIQTTGLTIQPNYVYPNGVQRLAGYAVTNSITALVRDLGRAGATIDAIAQAGGNATVINGLTFSVADGRAIDSAARVDAVDQAVARARAMAHAAGERLGPVCTLTDESPVQVPVSVFGPIPTASRAAAPFAPVPLAAGTEQATATVTVVYALQVG